MKTTKGKVEWFYKVAALMPDGKVGVDFIFTTTRLGKKDVQEMAESLKTNVHVEFIGTVIKPPKKDDTVFTYDYLTEEEKNTRLAFAKEQTEKEVANGDTIQ